MSQTTPPSPAAGEPKQPTHHVFERIYRHAIWGANSDGAGRSGSGSTLHSTLIYRTFLQQFLKDFAIRSVVDAGCGDWESTQALDWSGIDYKGYDIVEAVIAQNRVRFAKPNVQFFVANFVDTELPPADLLICKHVLQHLPTKDVQRFLSQTTKHEHVLLTNGVDPKTLSAENIDIAIGNYRRLDPTTAPFNIVAEKCLTYQDHVATHQVVHVRKSPNVPVEGTNRFTEYDVKLHLQSHGFSNIVELKLRERGLWFGRAQRYQSAFDVLVDAQGKVFGRPAG